MWPMLWWRSWKMQMTDAARDVGDKSKYVQKLLVYPEKLLKR